MRIATSTSFILLIMFLGSAASAQTIKVTTADGGSIVTELGYGIKVNKNSTLRRAWVVLNDPSCPVQLINAGINTQYGERQYNYVPTGSAKASDAISALEIRYLLYDVFGNHMKTLSATEVTDAATNAEISLKDGGRWRAWENEISELLTVVAFVAQVRTVDGKVWRYQDKPISEELSKIRLMVKTGDLDRTKENK
jgi:hypothetical protein